MNREKISGEKISVIIPVYNCIDYTRRCLESIFRCTDIPVEVIVVDNASTDGTSTILKRMGDKIHLIYNKKNLGYAAACNQGCELSQGSILVFLNNDTVVTPRWLVAMLSVYDTVDRVGMVTPKLLYPNSQIIQYAGVAFLPNTLPYILHYRKSDRDPLVNFQRETPGAGGACMVVSRRVFESVGQFDEAYINGLEDIDLCLKIKLAGYKNIFCPQSIIYHYESKTEGRSKYNQANINYYLQKWKDKIRVENGDVAFL